MNIEPFFHGIGCRELCLNRNGVGRVGFDEKEKGEDTKIQCVLGEVGVSNFFHSFIHLFGKYLSSASDGPQTLPDTGQGRDQRVEAPGLTKFISSTDFSGFTDCF